MRDPAKRGLANDGSVAKRQLISNKLSIKMTKPAAFKRRKRRK